MRSDSLNPRAVTLIETLDLTPHPEGGYYGEVYRSRLAVEPADGRGTRVALTTIYFLLPNGAVSRWHRVRSDEVWHYYEGAPLDLWIASARFDVTDQRRLGSLSSGQQQVWTVPAGSWQAARSRGAFTLVGCTVGPGFEFADFTLAASLPQAVADLRRHHPALEELL